MAITEPVKEATYRTVHAYQDGTECYIINRPIIIQEGASESILKENIALKKEIASLRREVLDLRSRNHRR